MSSHSWHLIATFILPSFNLFFPPSLIFFLRGQGVVYYQRKWQLRAAAPNGDIKKYKFMVAMQPGEYLHMVGFWRRCTEINWKFVINWREGHSRLKRRRTTTVMWLINHNPQVLRPRSSNLHLMYVCLLTRQERCRILPKKKSVCGRTNLCDYIGQEERTTASTGIISFLGERLLYLGNTFFGQVGCSDTTEASVSWLCTIIISSKCFHANVIKIDGLLTPWFHMVGSSRFWKDWLQPAICWIKVQLIRTTMMKMWP